MNNDFRLGHRQRLRDKFLENKLTDYELLELFLTYAIPRCDVRPIAKSLIKKFGSVYGVMSAPVESLVEVNGIKENTAIFIKATHELMKHGYRGVLADTPIFHDIKIVKDYALLLLGNKKKEEFHILYLDSEYRLLKDELHSVGTGDWTAVYTKEIVKNALDINAASIIMMHNHPQIQTSFSTEDVDATIRLIDMLKPLDIEFFDHFVVSGNVVYSIKNSHLLNKR